MTANRFPPGWDSARVQRVIGRYESQSEDEAVAEDEAASEQPSSTQMAIPTELVPIIRQLLAEHALKG